MAVGKIRFSLRFYVIVCLLLTVFFTVRFLSVGKKLAEQNAEILSLDHQIAAAEARNDVLSQQIAQAGSADSIERIAREELGWVYEDEIRFIPETGSVTADEN